MAFEHVAVGAAVLVLESLAEGCDVDSVAVPGQVDRQLETLTGIAQLGPPGHDHSIAHGELARVEVF